MSDARFPARVVSVLQDAAIDTWIFGGWAEELLGLTAPRPHEDVDLLHPADDWSDRDGVFTLFDGAGHGWPDDKRCQARAAREPGTGSSRCLAREACLAPLSPAP